MDVIAEFILESLEGEEHLSEPIATTARIIEREGLDYEVTSSGTTVQGELNTVLDCIAQCLETLEAEGRRVKSSLNLDAKPDWPPGSIQTQAEKVNKQLLAVGH